MMLKANFVLVLICLTAFTEAAQVTVVNQFQQGGNFNDLVGWQFTNNRVAGPNTVCGSSSMIGGYGILGARASLSNVYAGLQPHYSVTLKFTFYKIDSWDNHNFFVLADGVYVYNQVYGLNGQQICGVTTHVLWSEQVVPLTITFPHNSANLNIIMGSNLDEDATNESWGISDLSLTIETCPDGCTTCESADASKCSGYALASQSWMGTGIGSEGWNVQGGNPQVTTCGAIQIFGGFNNFGKGTQLSKVLPNLPPHSQVWIKLQFWAVDSWDLEYARIYLDGVVVFQTQFQWQQNWPNYLCAGTNQGWPDKALDISFQVAHTGTSATILITTTLDQGLDDESFGVRAFQIFTRNTDTTRTLFDSDLTGATFNSAEGWTAVWAENTNQITMCGSYQLFGGYGVFGRYATISKTFTGLPPHYAIQVSFILMKIDSWDNEQFFLYVDGTIASQKQYMYDQGTQMCGTVHQHYVENVERIDSTVKHSAGGTTITMTSSLDENSANESWGIREFYLYVYVCPQGCTICDPDNLKACGAWKLFDDEFGISSTFATAPQWQVSGGTADVSVCAGTQIFGGFNNWGKGASITRTFSNLPQHKTLRLQVQFWKIDSWDGELAIIQVDGRNAWQQAIPFDSGYRFSVCGQPDATYIGWREWPINVDLNGPHEGATVTITITSTIDQTPNDESWGIRDFKLFLEDGTNQTEDDINMTDTLWAITNWASNSFTDLEGWTIVKPYSSPYTQWCGAQKMVGGYNILGAQSSLVKSIPLPPHYKLRLRVKFFKIDSWDNEVFQIFVDGVNVYQQAFAYNQGTQICGVKSDWHEQEVIVDITIQHTNVDAVVALTSTLNENADNESWGVKNFRLAVWKCPDGCVTCTESTVAECKQWNQIGSYFTGAINDVQGWTVTGAQPRAVPCSGVPLAGGFGVFGAGASISRNFPNLPAHNILKLKVQFWKIDSWDNEEARVFADGKIIWKQAFAYNQGMPAALCGQQSDWYEAIVDVDVTFEHSAGDVTIVITSSLNQGADDESWGVRDIVLYNINVANIDDVGANDPNIYYKAFQGNGFTDTDGWNVVKPYATNIFGVCGSTRLLGGFGVLGAGSALVKQLSVPAHSDVTIRFELFKIDSWDNETFLMYIDGQSKYTSQFAWNQGSFLCGQPGGGGWQDQIVVVNVKVPHTSPTLTIVLTSNINEGADNESWGIRNFQLFYTACPSSCSVCSSDAKLNEKCGGFKSIATDFVSPTQSDWPGWTVDGATPAYSSCSGIRMFGGFNVFGAKAAITKTYNLPVHNKLAIRFQFWFIDSWDGEQAQLYVDNVLVWSQVYSHGAPGIITNLCGAAVDGWKEAANDFEVIIDHVNPTAVVKFTSTLDQVQADESWGIRDIQIIYDEYYNEDQIKDITDDKIVYSSFTNSVFADAAGWTVVNAKDPKNFITSCSGTRLLGGYGVFGKNGAAVLYQDLKPHWTISIRFTLYKIDSWDNEKFLLYVDGLLVQESSYAVTQGTGQCGVANANWNEDILLFNVKDVAHSSPNVEIILTSTLNEDATNESWGFRDFYLAVEQCPPGCAVCSRDTLTSCSTAKLIAQSWVTNDVQTADGWNVLGASKEPVGSNCAGIQLLGGFGVFGKGASISKVFQDLPPHNKLGIRFQFWKIDSWDGETASLTVDGRSVWGQAMVYHQGIQANVCGQGHDLWREDILNINLNVDHVDTQAAISLTTSLDQPADDESWGIRNFQIWYKEIQDLAPKPDAFYSAFYSNTFTATDGWVVNGATQSSVVSSCGDVRILGGYNIMGKGASVLKQLALPTHYQVDITFNFLKIDSWDNHNFFVWVDGVQIYNQQLGLAGTSQQCGVEHVHYVEQLVKVALSVQHNSPTFTIVITTDLDELSNNESWGIRDFVLNIKSCPEKCSVCTATTQSEAVCTLWQQVDSSLAQTDVKTFTVDGWQIYQDKKPIATDATKVSNCAGVPLLGGYNIFGPRSALTRNVVKLPVHNVARIKVQIWKIDSWNGETFSIYADSVLVYKRVINGNTGFQNSVCGQTKGWKDQSFDLDLQFNHVTDSITIAFATTLNTGTTNESWGIRDFQLFTETLTQSTVVVDGDAPYYQAFMTNQFSETEKWTTSNVAATSLITACGKDRMYGGFGVFGAQTATTKLLTNLPPHSQIRIKFQLFKIDSWENHQFWTYVDGDQVYQAKFSVSQGTQNCGSDNVKYTEQVSTVDITTPHNANSVTIVLTSSLNQAASNESWGFKFFQVWLTPCPKGCNVCTTKDTDATTCSSLTIVGQSLLGNDFPADSFDGWTTNIAKPGYSSCAGVQVFGGIGFFGAGAWAKKTFSALPNHNSLRLQLQFWKYDSWDNEKALIYVDDQLVWSQTFGSATNIPVSVCGTVSQWTEDLYDVDVTFDHMSPTANVEVRSTLDQVALDESWGIRDVILFTTVITDSTGNPDSKAFYSAFNTQKFTDSDGWTVNSPFQATIITACAGQRLLGGYKVFGKGSSIVKYITLPPHYEVSIKFKLYKIDSWDNEKFLLYVDGQQVFNQQFAYSQGVQSCGVQSDWNEVIVSVSATVQHNMPNVVIAMTSTLDENADNESWGIRDFELDITACPDACKTCTKDTLTSCPNWQLQSSSWTGVIGLTADGWTAKGGKEGISTCSDIPIIGGFNNFGQGASISKSFALPVHNRLYLQLQFWQIDSWDNERASVLVDGVEVWGQNFQHGGSTAVGLCGSNNAGWAEQVVDISVAFDHINPQPVVTVTSTLNQAADDESWGVRNFLLFTETNLDSTTTKPDAAAVSSSFFGNTFGDPDGWVVIQNYPNQPPANNQFPITTCGGTRLFGGYNILGAGNLVTKTFTLPPHKQVKIAMKLWKIDSWDQEQFLFYADGVQQQVKAYAYNAGKQLCGRQGDWNEVEDDYVVTINHNAPTLTIVMTSTLDEKADNESWGFREFQIGVAKCDDGCQTCSVDDKATCSTWKQFFSSWTQSNGLTKEGWELQGTSQIQQTTCGTTNIFGGFSQLGQSMMIDKTLFGLPSHTQAKLKFQIWKIDSWDGERLSLYIDGAERWGKSFVVGEAIQRDLCGSKAANWNDQILNVEVTVPHNTYTMVVDFKSTLDQPTIDESWGIRDFFIYTDIVDDSSDPNKPVYQAFTDPTITSTDDWIFENGPTTLPVSTCAKTQLVGGYGLFGANVNAIKKLNLKPHYQVTIQFQLFKIDSWDNEQFLVYIDGNQAYSQFFSYSQGTQICGQGAAQWHETSVLVSITVAHNSPQINIMLTSTLNQGATDESWGFRDFIVTTKPCPAGCAVCDNEKANQCKMWSAQEADWTVQNFETDGWTVFYGPANQQTVCAGSRLFGGFGSFGGHTYISKTFKGLPAHQKIRVQAQFWKIDSWDDERAALFADTREVWGQNYFVIGNTGFVRNLCGQAGWRDEITDIDISFVHTSDTLTLEFRTTIEQGATDESWGVRQLYIYVGKCADGCFDCTGTEKTDCIVTNDVNLFYQAFVGDFPLTDVNGWFTNNLKATNPVSTCGDKIKMFGGFNFFGTGVSAVRMLTLPPHYLVRVKFTLYKIDSWDDELFIVYIDGRETYLRRFSVGSGSQLCGTNNNGWNEDQVVVDVIKKHNAATLLVVLTSTLNEAANTESWGISDFQVYIEACPSGCLVCSGDDPALCSKWSAIESDWVDNVPLQVEGWKVTGAASQQLSNQCSGINMIGGPGVLGNNAVVSKQFSALPTHDMVKIQLQFWKIDGWDYQFAFIRVDGNMVWASYFAYWNGYKVQLCGSGAGYWNEQTYDIDIEVSNGNPNPLIEVSTNLATPASQTAWGVRQFTLFNAKCADNCRNCTTVQANGCLQCSGDFALQQGACVLPQNQLKVAAQFTDPTFTDLQGWTLTKPQGAKQTYVCESTTVVGGPGVLGAGAAATRIFNFGAHTTLRFKAQLWKFDSWDGEEFFVTIDGNVVWSKNINFDTNGLPRCGNGNFFWQEVLFDIDITIPHTSPTATIVISSTLDESADNESFGFRDVYVYVQTTEQCAYFYSECNYQGESVEFCRESRNTLKQHFLPQIKSFKIPPNGKVNVYQDSTFDSQVVELTDSNQCVDDSKTLSMTGSSATTTTSSTLSSALSSGSTRLLFIMDEEPTSNLRRAKP